MQKSHGEDGGAEAAGTPSQQAEGENPCTNNGLIPARNNDVASPVGPNMGEPALGTPVQQDGDNGGGMEMDVDPPDSVAYTIANEMAAPALGNSVPRVDGENGKMDVDPASTVAQTLSVQDGGKDTNGAPQNSPAVVGKGSEVDNDLVIAHADTNDETRPSSAPTMEPLRLPQLLPPSDLDQAQLGHGPSVPAVGSGAKKRATKASKAKLMEPTQEQRHIPVMVTPEHDHKPAWGEPLTLQTPLSASAVMYIPECEGIIVTTGDNYVDIYPKKWVAGCDAVILQLPTMKQTQGRIWYEVEDGILDEEGKALGGTWIQAEKVELPHDYVLVILEKKWRQDWWSGYSVLRASSEHLSANNPEASKKGNKGKRKKH